MSDEAMAAGRLGTVPKLCTREEMAEEEPLYSTLQLDAGAVQDQITEAQDQLAAIICAAEHEDPSADCRAQGWLEEWINSTM